MLQIKIVVEMQIPHLVSHHIYSQLERAQPLCENEIKIAQPPHISRLRPTQLAMARLPFYENFHVE